MKQGYWNRWHIKYPQRDKEGYLNHDIERLGEFCIFKNTKEEIEVPFCMSMIYPVKKASRTF